MGVSGYKGHDYTVKAIVVKCKESNKVYMRQVYIPSYHGKYNSNLVGDGTNHYPWAYGGDNLEKDNLNEVVWVTFEGGDIRSPVITGGLGGITNSDISTTNIGGGDGEVETNYSTVAELAVNLVYKNESGGNYGTIVGNDNGALSIGLIGWHGDNARNLLNRVKEEHLSDFEANGGNSLSLSGSWASLTITEDDDYWDIIYNILISDGGKAVQDACALEYMNSYINTAVALGVTQVEALLYYCDCSTQTPAGAKSMVENASSKDIDGLHNYVLTSGCWLGTANASWGALRRKKTYDAIKQMRENGELDSADESLGSDYLFPVQYDTAYISSTFGMRTLNGTTKLHSGIDIAIKGGGDDSYHIVATKEGEVVQAKDGCTHNYPKNASCGCNNNLANYIAIQHPDGNVSFYLHLSSLKVSVGDHVIKGQHIGNMGCTGYSTGWHLHFQIQEGGGIYYNKDYAVDPLNYVSL